MNNAYEQKSALAIEELLATPLQWIATPEEFYELVFVTTFTADQQRLPLTSSEKALGLKAPTMDNIAAALQEVMIVDLYPYENFAALKNSGNTSTPLCEKGIRVTRRTETYDNIRDSEPDTAVVRHPYDVPMEKFVFPWADAFISKLAEKIRFENIDFSKIVLAMKLA